MHFDLLQWLFTSPYDAGTSAGQSGSETFHFLWPWLVFCCAGLLITFYYMVEGRKRFVKSRPLIKYMLDRYLGWFSVICFIGLPLIFSRVYLDEYFFSWRFWRYLWLVALLVWLVLWIRYMVAKYPKERESFQYYQKRQQYIPKGNKRRSRALTR